MLEKEEKKNRIPDRWKLAEVVPIYKLKGRKEDPENYRNISILSALKLVWGPVFYLDIYTGRGLFYKYFS